MEVNREHLAGAIETVRLALAGEGHAGTGMEALSSEGLAVRLLHVLGARAGVTAPPAADPELSAMAAILAVLDALPNQADYGTPSGPVWRVLRFVAERHGFVICTED